ncbi:hypothetical protein OG196_00470 [Kitasatospora purpeofusca]|uniref:hypothetical protein n=1 Tax=Kitasatospora purpeofusca TaxID=67352 RepID=UPI002E154E12|nr:hypothetical protein OG196_00470 [Kitasatospora purpeofusca]
MHHPRNTPYPTGPRARRPMAARAGALTLALTVTTALPAFAAPAGGGPSGGQGGATAAKAFRNGRSIPVKDALRACRRSNCNFRVTAGPTEYVTAVTNVGSTVVNCTNADMAVEREVTLTSGITDNIEGEISGKATIEGTVDNTTEVTTTAEKQESVTQQTTETTTNTSTATTEVAAKVTGTQTNSSGNTFHTAPKDTGPNSEFTSSAQSQTQAETAVTNTAQNQVAKEAQNQLSTTTQATGTVSARDELHVGVKGAFEAAFRLTAGTELAETSSEKMTYKITLKPKDILVLSAQNAMVRTNGVLHVDDDAGASTVENITVDSPSTVNASSLLAQTFTGAEQCETPRPTQDAKDPQPTQPNRRTSTPGLYDTPPPPPGRTPTSSVVLLSDARTPRK